MEERLQDGIDINGLKPLERRQSNDPFPYVYNGRDYYAVPVTLDETLEDKTFTVIDGSLCLLIPKVVDEIK